MIVTTWNDLPHSVRVNTCAYYIPKVHNKEIKSVVDGIIKDYGCKSFNTLAGLSKLAFTDDQWVWFLLRWA